MRKFDLEAAKRGAAVCTRDGRNARIIAFDCKGCGRKPILALIDMGDWEQSASWTERGEIIEDFKDASDLMMRDDDYAEKLARGEYGKHIEDKLEKVEREHLRRELSEKIMVAMIRELAGKSPHSASNNITVYEAMAADAVSYADALLEELEKKK
jgi:hypothetical protein